MNNSSKCKICGSNNIVVFAHTATCLNCGVLLCYPYPEVLEEKFLKNCNNISDMERNEIQKKSLAWHLKSGSRNHYNFTNMVEFTLNDKDRFRQLSVLDYGGGGGQFALVLKSLYPKTDVYIVDMNNEKLLNEFKPLNNQIRFEDFNNNQQKFDVIFLNDVFEHVTDPLYVLKHLSLKLKNGGIIFIDTPCQFWLYPITKIISKKIHTKLLLGTVDYDHQQIWSKKSFETVVEKAGMKIEKFDRLCEFTQGADFYMTNMKINNPFIRFFGKIFFILAPFIAKNKIMSVISNKS